MARKKLLVVEQSAVRTLCICDNLHRGHCPLDPAFPKTSFPIPGDEGTIRRNPAEEDQRMVGKVSFAAHVIAFFRLNLFRNNDMSITERSVRMPP